MRGKILTASLLLLVAITVNLAFAQVHGKITTNTSMEMEKKVIENETNTTFEVPTEKSAKAEEIIEKEITPRVETYISNCEASLQDRGIPADVAEMACKFAVGVQKKAQTLGEKLAKCIAEAYLANANATYGELKRYCIQKIIEVLPVPKCPLVTVPHCPEGYYPKALIDDKGCVVSYSCMKISETALDFRACVKEKVAGGTRDVEAVKECMKEVREVVRKQVRTRLREVTSSLPPADVLEAYLRCMDLPEDAREEAFELADELSELISEHSKVVRNVTATCTAQLRNLTSESELIEVKEECSERLKEVNDEFRKEMKDLKEKIAEIYEAYKSTLNVTCVNEILNARNVTAELREEIEQVLSNQSLGMKEKRTLIEKKLTKVFETLKERVQKLPKFGNLTLREGVRELMREKGELKNEILRILKTDKATLREVIKDPVVRSEIVNTLLEDPEDRELLKEAIRNRKARIDLIKHARTKLKLKQQLLAREIVKEILPTRLKQKFERINVTDLDVEEVGNRTAVRAQVIETGRLFFIIPVKVPKVVKFVGEEIIAEQRPWWAFLVVG